MGVLDDAIREHLELKRRHGASEAELKRQAAEALGPARRDPQPAREPERSSEEESALAAGAAGDRERGPAQEAAGAERPGRAAPDVEERPPATPRRSDEEELDEVPADEALEARPFATGARRPDPAAAPEAESEVDDPRSGDAAADPAVFDVETLGPEPPERTPAQPEGEEAAAPPPTGATRPVDPDDERDYVEAEVVDEEVVDEVELEDDAVLDDTDLLDDDLVVESGPDRAREEAAAPSDQAASFDEPTVYHPPPGAEDESAGGPASFDEPTVYHPPPGPASGEEPLEEDEEILEDDELLEDELLEDEPAPIVPAEVELEGEELEEEELVAGEELEEEEEELVAEEALSEDERAAEGALSEDERLGRPDLPLADEEDLPPEEHDEDVLEETPEFLQETPENERLWFEQRPPRDFDLDR